MLENLLFHEINEKEKKPLSFCLKLIHNRFVSFKKYLCLRSEIKNVEIIFPWWDIWDGLVRYNLSILCWLFVETMMKNKKNIFSIFLSTVNCMNCHTVRRPRGYTIISFKNRINIFNKFSNSNSRFSHYISKFKFILKQIAHFIQMLQKSHIGRAVWVLILFFNSDM